jgi:hypothetical protein
MPHCFSAFADFFPPTAEGRRGWLKANSGGWEWMGGGEARWTDEKGINPLGDDPRPEEALCGVPPPRGDIAAHRPPPAGGMECGPLGGGRGSPEEADTGRSPVGEMRSEEGHLGDGERRRQGGGPGLGSAAGVVEDVRPSRRRQLEAAEARDQPSSSPDRRRLHALRAREAARYHRSYYPLQWLTSE